MAEVRSVLIGLKAPLVAGGVFLCMLISGLEIVLEEEKYKIIRKCAVDLYICKHCVMVNSVFYNLYYLIKHCNRGRR